MPKTLNCSRHGERETLLTCGRCGQPYCTACLIHTPAGQRCHQCAGRQSPRRRASNPGRPCGRRSRLRQAPAPARSSLSGWWFILLFAGIAGFAGATRWAPLVNNRTRNRSLAIMALSFFGGTIAGPTHLCPGADARAGHVRFPLLPSRLRSATPCCCSSPPSPPASPGGGCGSPVTAVSSSCEMVRPGWRCRCGREPADSLPVVTGAGYPGRNRRWYGAPTGWCVSASRAVDGGAAAWRPVPPGSMSLADASAAGPTPRLPR